MASIQSSLRVLVIEDDSASRLAIVRALRESQHTVFEAADGVTGLEIARSEPLDAVVLDLMLPDLDGLEICRRIRASDEHRRIGVIMVTAKGDEADVVAGIELGADDYLSKPFSPRVLVARVKSVMRRSTDAKPAAPRRIDLAGGRLGVDPERHVTTIDGKPVELTLTEFGMLHFLALRPGFVRTRDQIITAVHGRNVVLSSRTVDVHMTALRRKMGELGALIETVRGVGYRFAEGDAASVE
jgi:two-component system phosphate regulon response regulator PhoB